MSRNARRMLLALQALVLGLPLFLGGRQTLAAASASLVVLVLLAVEAGAVKEGSGFLPSISCSDVEV